LQQRQGPDHDIGEGLPHFEQNADHDIRHHFLRDHAIKRDIVISHVGTNDQLADIFTKPLDEKRFHELQSEINIIDS
jgi:hypothetical protein